jgi:hypothetical protein
VHIIGMLLTVTKIDSTTTSSVPFRKFLGILESRIEDIDWAAKDVKILKMMMIMEFSTSE